MLTFSFIDTYTNETIFLFIICLQILNLDLCNSVAFSEIISVPFEDTVSTCHNIFKRQPSMLLSDMYPSDLTQGYKYNSQRNL